jgi:hypothetical protein
MKEYFDESFAEICRQETNNRDTTNGNVYVI